jgi:signal transduction histidine kinase
MEMISATLLAWLEITFIFAVLSLLHNQRKNIGTTPLYISMGVVFLFAQLLLAADLRVSLLSSIEFQLGPTVIFLPYLAMILLIYLIDGTLATQRLIIGSFVVFFVFFYIAEITRLQCNWQGYSIAAGQSASELDFLLQRSIYSMGGMSIAHLVDLFIIPISYNSLKNLKCRRFIAICGALIITQVIDVSIFAIVYYFKNQQIWNFLAGAFFIRSFFSIWLGIIISAYLGNQAGENKGTFDILFAFLGGYGKSKELQNYLAQSEDRYRTIWENARELIFLLGNRGNIIDCNQAAKQMLARILPSYDKNSDLFYHMLPIDDGEGGVLEEDNVPQGENHSFKAKIKSINGADYIDLACTLSHVVLENEQVLLLIARDITKEIVLQQEKEKLSNELIHSQRLEALGKLAGGIAHDFNNHIHALLGHVDLLLFQKDLQSNEKVIKHLHKIGTIAEQSGKLTSQLLGFARKGKFVETDLDLNVLLSDTLAMINLPSANDVVLSSEINSNKYLIRGDWVQLSQVIINLVINAGDAVKQSKLKNIIVMAKEAICFELEIVDFLAVKKINPENFYCVKISDTGSGISAENRQKIFEPFFTTKPIGEGTGMGLSMAYGTITNHHGYIHVESEVNQGTSFYILLPKI